MPTQQDQLVLVSHALCPYVQRAAISLMEKGVAFERRFISLADKPKWFREISPLGKVPLLQVGQTTIFESAVILEYLEDSQPNPLHPSDALERAEHRSWIEFGSTILSQIAGLYNAPDEESFAEKREQIAEKFDWLERRIGEGPYFTDGKFTLVDAVFGPIFRYFDVFDEIEDFGFFSDKPKCLAWRAALGRRKSVKESISSDYADLLKDFLIARQSYLSSRMVT